MFFRVLGMDVEGRKLVRSRSLATAGWSRQIDLDRLRLRGQRAADDRRELSKLDLKQELIGVEMALRDSQPDRTDMVSIRAPCGDLEPRVRPKVGEGRVTLRGLPSPCLRVDWRGLDSPLVVDSSGVRVDILGRVQWPVRASREQ